MKLPDNPVPPEAQSAWDARSGKLYLALNMKYTNIQYPWPCRSPPWLPTR